MRNNHIGTKILFLLTPLLSIPVVIHGIYKRENSSTLIFIFIIGIISYLFVPSLTNDKAYYYFIYDNIKYSSFSEFYTFFLTGKTDFVFYLLIYLFKTLAIPLHFLFFFITSLTLWLWFSPIARFSQKYPLTKNRTVFVFFLIILFSFSPSGILSGVRFYLAISLVFYSFCTSFLLNGNKRISLIIIILASLTHFSCVIFVPVFLLLWLRPNNDKLYVSLFLLSFIFILIPRDFLLTQFSRLSLSDVFESKTSSYLGDSDYIENSLSVGNFNNFLKFFFKTLWVYLAYFYLFFNKKQSVIRNSFLLAVAISNLFYSAPTVYNRYIILALGLFIILIIRDNWAGIKNHKFIYMLLVILGLNFFGNIYAMKDSFTKSLNKIDVLSFPTILMKEDIKYKDLK